MFQLPAACPAKGPAEGRDQQGEKNWVRWGIIDPVQCKRRYQASLGMLILAVT